MTRETDRHDPAVSRVYRDLGTEKTPASLDDQVLAMAAHEARTRYGLARAWIRPVAWAATIGLSLAIVLEVSQFDDPVTTELTAPAVAEKYNTTDPAIMKAKDEDRARRSISQSADISIEAEAAGALEEAATVAAPARSPEVSTKRAAPPEEAALDDAGPALEVDVQADASTDDPRPAAAFAMVERKEQVAHCSDEARATVDSWYECVKLLRAQGRTDDAALEFEVLLEEFPDFDEPDPE